MLKLHDCGHITCTSYYFYSSIHLYVVAKVQSDLILNITQAYCRTKQTKHNSRRNVILTGVYCLGVGLYTNSLALGLRVDFLSVDATLSTGLPPGSPPCWSLFVAPSSGDCNCPCFLQSLAPTSPVSTVLNLKSCPNFFSSACCSSRPKHKNIQKTDS